MGNVFASDQFEPVDGSLLVKSFSMTKAEKAAISQKDQTIFTKTYKKIISAFQYVRNNELKSQVLRNMGENSSLSNFTSNRVESNATNHLQTEVQKGLDYSIRSEVKLLGTMSHDIQLFELFSDSEEHFDPIRYDLVATDIRPSATRYYMAALHTNDFEILQHIEQDEVDWTIEPVRTKNLHYKRANLPSKDYFSKIQTTLRFSSAYSGEPGLVFGLSALNDFYRLNLYSSPVSIGSGMTHTFSVPYRFATVSTEMSKEMNLNRVSLIDVARLGENTWLNFSYLAAGEDIRADFVVRKSDLPISLGAIMSLN